MRTENDRINGKEKKNVLFITEVKAIAYSAGQHNIDIISSHSAVSVFL